MDWRAIKFDWNHARAFLVTAEEGSLSAAAKALGMSQPTLGRQVTALESHLGVQLFERSGRGLELTPSGLDVLEHVRAMGEAATAFSLSVSGQTDSVEGSICVSATEVMAVYVLPPVILRLRDLAPGIQIELIASNEESNLKRREADIAFRGFRPTQQGLIAKKLRDVVGRLYATPAYLASIGNPTTPVELSRASFIAFDGYQRLVGLLNSRGFNISNNNFPITAENRIVQWQLVKSGAGIGIMPEHVGDADSSVCRVLSGDEPITAELWIVTHGELRTNRRVRMVFDFLVTELS